MATILDRAHRRHAYIVFVDEAGFMLNPVVRATWAPIGCTPVIRVAKPHGRISLIGAISVSPKRRHFAFHFRLSEDNTNFRGPTVVQFVEFLRRKIRKPITILWDEIAIHHSRPVIEYLHKHRRIVVDPFPPYAPELNPVDYVWAYVKYNRLANYTPRNLDELRIRVTNEFRRLQKRPDLLRSFFDHTGLSFDPVAPCNDMEDQDGSIATTSEQPPPSQGQLTLDTAFDDAGLAAHRGNNPSDSEEPELRSRQIASEFQTSVSRLRRA